MNKPRLCLALSVSLALLQASVMPALSEPASPAIWQKLAGVSKPVAKSAAKTTKVVSAQTKRPVAAKSVVNDGLGLYTAYGLASGFADSQVMLFFGKGKDAASQMPAAALTIHPTLPVVEDHVNIASAITEKPTLVAMGEPVGGTQVAADGGPVSSVPANEPSTMVDSPKPVQPEMAKEILASKSESNDKLQIAQLAPDQIIAQGDNSGTLSTPIPPVVSGAVELEEFKPSNMIELKVNQSRTFKLRNKIVRTSISEPSIAEPVVVAENQMVLLGKAPGGATMVVWDDAGNSAAIDIKVTRDFSALQSTIREIDPRIIVKPFTVGGGDRVLLVGDVDHPESVIRAFSAANVFMDDRGMSILAANSRIMGQRIGEQAQTGGGGGGAAGGGGGGGGGGASSGLSQISQVDKYTFFSNLNNNVGKAQVIVSEAARVTSLIRVRKTPLIVLHVTFMEMNSVAVRELGLQLGLNFTNNSFAFGLGGGGTGNQAVMSTLPGLNGSNPGGYGFDPAGTRTALNGTFTAPQSMVNPLGLGAPISFLAPALATSTAVPSQAANWVSQILGYFQQLPQKLPGYGAVTAPVRFLNGTVINPSGAVNDALSLSATGTSPVGQGVMSLAPNALLQASSLFGSAPGAGTFSPGGLANMFTSMSNFASGNLGRWSINPTVQGIITQRRARVLAEPTLVTISGERASFLAGGEIPILQSIATAGTAQQSISFEPFGLRLNIIPVLLETGTINLQVSPEERLLDQANGLNLLGAGTSQIPAFIVRKTQTIVEMKPGQELYISGLVSANSSRELNKTPILGEIPVLGALYKSKAFNKNESELVVAVRPEIILPGTPGQLKLPEEISRTEGPRDTNILQVEPTVIDERYMTSGRAERPQRVPGIQAGSSPVPDNF